MDTPAPAPYSITEVYRDGGTFVHRFYHLSDARMHLRAMRVAHPARTYTPEGFNLRPGL